MKKKLILPLLAATILLTGCGSSDSAGDSGTIQETEEPGEQDGYFGQIAEDAESSEGAVEASSNAEDAHGEKEPADIDGQEMEEEGIIMNGIEIIKDCPIEDYQPRGDADYGIINHYTYHSETTGLDRGVNVLLPANYDEAKEYPVLYMLHGIFGDEYSLSGDINNRLIEIMGNLQSDGSAKEMIIVLPNMYASSDPDQKPAFNNEAVAPYDNFINDLVNDLIPFIEETYSVAPGRENRAILGFSMGGRETLFIGLSRPDLFAYVGAIAPAPGLVPGKDWAMTHPGQLEEDELTFAGKDFEPTVLMICCGTQDGTVGKFPENYHNIFERNGVTHTWYEIPGADHDSQAIRSGLYNFVRAVFKN